MGHASGLGIACYYASVSRPACIQAVCAGLRPWMGRLINIVLGTLLSMLSGTAHSCAEAAAGQEHIMMECCLVLPLTCVWCVLLQIHNLFLQCSTACCQGECCNLSRGAFF
jgi:hypothetical protein